MQKEKRKTRKIGKKRKENKNGMKKKKIEKHWTRFPSLVPTFVGETFFQSSPRPPFLCNTSSFLINESPLVM
ncbi:uncharacterized protein TRIVIDRAFT_215127 [Trichoderma virens Gv29-8]|uniref:Uncharacterized protein n=1 Tax=Hypocrea virens (strain Gv29-8 / FGSC 10586) TaxID=413071 RepID=G9ME90_HYPVG|nr:uncharacterized protein TRIVIDRAFT_215127 [Trichoderma virens Gv29-8]EHK27382.1 hypothetical protein TRIVIDRAFT_185494 [Trichoderma virens Gv29-8]